METFKGNHWPPPLYPNTSIPGLTATNLINQLIIVMEFQSWNVWISTHEHNLKLPSHVIIRGQSAALNIFDNGQHIWETLKNSWYTCRSRFVFWGKWLISSDWRRLQTEQRAKHRDKVEHQFVLGAQHRGMTRHLRHCQLKAGHNVSPCAATYWGGDSAATGRPTSYGAARLRRRRYVHNLGAQPASKIATLALAEPIQTVSTVTKAKKMTSVHHHSKIEGPKCKI